MTITRPATAHAGSVAEVLRPEVWTAVRDLEDRKEVREVLDYFLAEAVHEAQTVKGARSLLRAADLLMRDLLYLERLVEALRRRHEPALQEREEQERRARVRVERQDVRDSLRAARARSRSGVPDNVVPLRRRSA